MQATSSAVCLVLALFSVTAQAQPRLSKERVAFMTDFGEIEIGFYPQIAPVTVKHILKLFQLGAYNTNHIFRVHPGFVAQISGVSNGRIAPMNTEIKKEEAKTVPLEVSAEVKHVPGIVSMARHSNPHSGRSSFSMLLGTAPHLDGEFTIFGNVTRGFEALEQMQKVETFKQGIFVKPRKRVHVYSSYWYSTDNTCKFQF